MYHFTLSFLLCIGLYCDFIQASPPQKENDKFKSHILTKKDAHTLFGRSLIPNKQDAKREKVREIKQGLVRCIYDCYDQWTFWSSSCDSDCFGKKVRTRKANYQCVEFDQETGCQGPRYEEKACNCHCDNGGRLVDGACKCKDGFRGQCCEEEVSCNKLDSLKNGKISASNGNHTGSILKFTCNEGFEIVGEHQSICLSTGSWTNEKPVCQEVSCNKVGSLKNGKISASNGNHTGSILKFTCNEGFEIVGEHQSICLSTGSWTNEKPVCKEVSCNKVDSLKNGKVSASNGNHTGSILKFTCNEGFEIFGELQSVCLSTGSWSNEKPICKEVSCNKLYSLKNGKISASNGNHTGSILKFTCNEGFEIVGELQSVCLSTGSWSNEKPICKAILCDEINSLKNGKVIVSDANHFGSMLTFTCNEGFELIGEYHSVCQGCGSWSNPKPQCNEVSCNKMESLKNGKFSSSNGNSIGSKLTFTCNDGFKIVGKSQSICLPSGSWENEKPVCKGAGSCDEIINLENGKIYASNENNVGSELLFHCNKGFQIKGSEYSICLENGTWSHEKPICKGSFECAALNHFSHGSVKASNRNLIGSTMKLQCDPNYWLYGYDEVICDSNGHWSHEPGKCLPVEKVIVCDSHQVHIACPNEGVIQLVKATSGFSENCTPKPSDFQVSLKKASLKTWWHIASECNGQKMCSEELETIRYKDKNLNYIIFEYVCTYNESNEENLNSYEEAGSCDEIISLENGVMYASNENNVGSELLFHCNEGFRIAGSLYSICLEDGSWSHEKPICQGSSECAALNHFSHGSFKASNKNLLGSIMKLQCDNNYLLFGYEEVICESNGHWSHEPGKCLPVEKVIVCDSDLVHIACQTEGVIQFVKATSGFSENCTPIPSDFQVSLKKASLKTWWHLASVCNGQKSCSGDIETISYEDKNLNYIIFEYVCTY